MIVDGREGALESADDADVCVVGAGPAGVALALALAPTGQRIVLLEAGGLGYDPRVQRLFEGEVEGDPFPPLRDTRLGALGGATGVWAGFCRPLEDSDFAPRHGSPGWPFGAAALAPYWRRAHAVCQLGEYDYDARRWSARLGLPLLGGDTGAVRSLVFHRHALRFGGAYRRQLEATPNLVLALHAPVTRLALSASGGRVDGIVVRRPAGQDHLLRARVVVLAAGGIENARLLLLSGDRAEEAPGNAYGLVGRYFTDHPFVEPGFLALSGPAAPLDFYFPQPAGGATLRGALTLDPDIVAREGLLNGAILLQPRYEGHDAFASPEVKSLLEAFARLTRKSVPGGVGRDLLHALRAPGKVSTALSRKLFVRHGPAKRWRLRMMFETESVFENRVTLSERLDPLGRRRARVEWRLTDRDIASMRAFTALVSDGLQRSAVGRIDLKIPDNPAGWRSAAIGGKHHMGTTRMHVEPTHGVVDADCRVHGTSNLFVTGSSVFPSGGFANPTLTIVALALRLGDHLVQMV